MVDIPVVDFVAVVVVEKLNDSGDFDLSVVGLLEAEIWVAILVEKVNDDGDGPKNGPHGKNEIRKLNL